MSETHIYPGSCDPAVRSVIFNKLSNVVKEVYVEIYTRNLMAQQEWDFLLDYVREFNNKRGGI